MNLSLAIEASCGLRLKLLFLVFLLRFSLSSKINISKFQFVLEIKLSPIFRDSNRATVFLIHFFQFDFEKQKQQKKITKGKNVLVKH